MQSGILGLPKAGKTVLFNLLTASAKATDKFSQSTVANLAVAKVPDPRLEAQRDLHKPQKFTPATVDYVDIPGIQKGEGAESLNLTRLKEVDALIHVVRAFEDPELPHPEGSVDPLRDLATIDLELILADMEIVERRLERLAKGAKRGSSPEEERERRLLAETVLPALEGERPLRELELQADDERRLRTFQFLSAKPMLVVWNVAEGDLLESSALPTFGEEARRRAVVMSATIEEEISQLPFSEQREFLDELGLVEPGLHRVLQATYRLLGLISFFTVGEDEVRAWTVRQGTSAKLAGGVIHSDIARGFIRAEVVSADDLLHHGTLAACRDNGLLRLEGKDYIVQDGEIVHFRFNV